MHRPQSIVYKVDNLVLRTPLSSLVLLNIRVVLLLNTKPKFITQRSIYLNYIYYYFPKKSHNCYH